MHTKAWKWLTPVAAAAAIAIAIVSWPGPHGSGKVYGMSDVPELLRNARILHIAGWGEIPEDDPGKMKGPRSMEYWFDREEGRMRTSSTTGDLDENGQPIYLDTVCDGQYVMDVSISQRAKGPWERFVRFRRISPYQARLQAYRASLGTFVQFFGNLEHVAGFQKAGQEIIDGMEYCIWSGQITHPIEQPPVRIEAWVAPHTGQIGRVRVSSAMDPGRPDKIMRLEFTHVERDVAVSPDIFRTDPPAGVRLDNTKQTAPESILGFGVGDQVERYALYALIGFTLPDGSVLLAWSSPEKGVDQSPLFEGLIPGGPLPELPAVIVGMGSLPQVPGVRYTGRHLAYARRGDRYIEWTLYVPVGIAPSRDSFLQFDFQTRKNKDGIYATWATGLSDDLPIANQADFDTWVRGAMAELSDGDAAPEQITYEYVMGLSKQIRLSLQGEAAAK